MAAPRVRWDALRVRIPDVPGKEPVTTAAPSLLSVVYTSTATSRFDDADLATLLAASRLANDRRGLSGLLLHRDGRFMQVLEGPEPEVRRTLAVIAADPRHTDVEVLDEESIEDRRFASWAMAYRSMSGSDPLGWFGSAANDRAGALGSRAAAMLAAFRGDAD